jgi:hypothetical protein
MVCNLFSGSIKSRILLFLIVVFAGMHANAQLLDTRVNITLDSSGLDKNLLQLQHTSGLSFAYETSGLPVHFIPAKTFHHEKLSTILQYLFKGTGYEFEERHGVIIIVPGAIGLKAGALERLVKGVIEDKETGERLPGVAIYSADNKYTGTYTDKDGYFSIPALSDTLKLQLSYMSYKPVEIVLLAAGATVVRIKMDIPQKNLDSILVVLPTDISAMSSLSDVSPSLSYLSFLPKFAGDVDLLSMTKIAPGIQETVDGSGSILVRGGAPDQNLLLIDDATIYGATHLFGLSSSANVLAVKDIHIYKSSFPARFAGRISSVWDISLKNGNPEKLHGTLSIGTFASDFMFEGPIVKNKTTFMVSGRRSYHDYYIRRFTPGLKNFYYQDINAKIHHRFSDQDDIYFTVYYSKDKFNLGSDTLLVRDDYPFVKQSIFQNLLLNTQNRAATFRWRHYWGTRLSSNLSLSYSDYRQLVENKNSTITLLPLAGRNILTNVDESIYSGLSDLSMKLIARYALSNTHNLEGGIYYTRHSFIPHTFNTDFSSSDSFLAPPPPPHHDIIKDGTANGVDLFLEDIFEISSGFIITGGVHLNKYFSGKADYFSFQPRMRIHYKFREKWSLDVGYTSMQQSLHRLSISRTSLPVDFWVPSTAIIKPQVSNQLSAGISGKLLHGLLDLGIESYYKSMKNVADYLLVPPMDSSQESKESSWDQRVTTGKGVAYGIEISIRKSNGKLKSWFSYALSWSNRTFPEINNGQTFPFKYERRHSINIINVLKLSKHLDVSCIFSFQSMARPPVLTIKTADTTSMAEYLRATAALTEQLAYHRLDLGANWLMLYGKKGINAILNLSVLNVYNRKNVFYYFSSAQDSTRPLSTTLMPVAISLSYTLKF